MNRFILLCTNYRKNLSTNMLLSIKMIMSEEKIVVLYANRWQAGQTDEIVFGYIGKVTTQISTIMGVIYALQCIAQAYHNYNQ